MQQSLHISSNGKTFDFLSNNENPILSMCFQTVILMAVLYYAKNLRKKVSIWLKVNQQKKMESGIIENGFDRNFPIMEWHGFIVDGHNRYDICKKHNITDYVVGTLAYETKEEVMEWMLDIQLGRRNLSPIQRIAVAEKYRPLYEKEAKENKSKAGGDKKSTEYKKSVTANLPQPINDNKKRNPTTDKKIS